MRSSRRDLCYLRLAISGLFVCGAPRTAIAEHAVFLGAFSNALLASHANDGIFTGGRGARGERFG